MPSVLGIDSGLTVTKAVIFDADGSTLAVARRRVAQIMTTPHHVERDMDELWQATAEAIREAISASGRPASDIVAVAATAHGDGIYLLDAERRPLGLGIVSLDSRAGDIVAEWAANGVADRSLALTGQMPHPAAPSAVLAWIKRNEPERYARIAHMLPCKDYLRFCLSGTIGTDRTEASTSFTNVTTQDYDPDILALFDLSELAHALPPIAHSAEIVGHVTAEAAARTGLMEGTPVAAGLHDVTASSLGVGAHVEGVIAVIAGTYSINEVLSREPRTDPRWLCRNAIEPGLWHSQAISPASSANYEWFLETLCRSDRATAAADGASIHDRLGAEIDAAMARRSTALFHPFLFGSPFGPQASAGFFGLRAWQGRGEMLRAVLEGIAFNHRVHVDALREGFEAKTIRITGGISRSPRFVQMFCDVLGLPVSVTETDEAAAWGTALCAGAGAGLFPSPSHDPRDLESLTRTYSPDPARQAEYETRYRLFTDLAAAMAPLWPRIDALAAGDAP